MDQAVAEDLNGLHLWRFAFFVEKSKQLSCSPSNFCFSDGRGCGCGRGRILLSSTPSGGGAKLSLFSNGNGDGSDSNHGLRGLPGQHQ